MNKNPYIFFKDSSKTYPHDYNINFYSHTLIVKWTFKKECFVKLMPLWIDFRKEDYGFGQNVQSAAKLFEHTEIIRVQKTHT